MSTGIRSDAGRTVVVVNGNDKLAINDDGSIEALSPATTLGENDIPTRGQAGPVSATSQSASGTSVDFTGIPTWAKRITVMLSGVSTNGTSQPLIQIGASGSIENTGYDSRGWRSASGGNPATLDSTAGFIIGQTWAATTLVSGSVTLVRMTGDTWMVESSAFISSVANTVYQTYGIKTLAGALDRIRITTVNGTVNGTDQFDAGTINIMWE